MYTYIERTIIHQARILHYKISLINQEIYLISRKLVLKTVTYNHTRLLGSFFQFTYMFFLSSYIY